MVLIPYRTLIIAESKTHSPFGRRSKFPGWFCQASNIKTLADIASDADAVLIGTHLEALADKI